MDWQINNEASKAEFTQKKFWGMVTAKGTFKALKGIINYDEANPAEGSVYLEFDPASVSSKNKQRDTHLVGEHFFWVEKYPVITFKSTAIKAAGAGKFEVTGDLTVRGITRSLTLLVDQTEATPGKLSFKSEIIIHRVDFGMTWKRIPMSPDTLLQIELVAVPASVPAGRS